MKVLGIGAREVIALAREQRRVRSSRGPLLVTGVLADQLVRELSAGGDAALVRTSGDPTRAAAVVHVFGGAATPDAERELRAATRALVPVVAVQTGDPATRLPYVLAPDIVDCPPGQGFPVEEIAGRLAAALGRDGATLAAGLPVLRDAVRRRRAAEGAVSAASLAVMGAAAGPRMPLLALAQVRMLSDLAFAGGPRPAGGTPDGARELAVPLGAALGTGIAARTLVRRLPFRSRAFDGLVAAGATLALGVGFGRIANRS